MVILSSSWDLYRCPPTLASVSACLRDNTMTRIAVFLLWGFLGFHGFAELSRGSSASQGSCKKRPLWGPHLFALAQVVLSLPAIIFQVGHSIPGAIVSGQPWVMAALTACIGVIQGVIGNFVIPLLAQKLTSHKHLHITVANLLVNCVFPVAVIFLGSLDRDWRYYSGVVGTASFLGAPRFCTLVASFARIGNSSDSGELA